MTMIRPEIRVAVIGAGMAGRAHANGYRAIRSLFSQPPAAVRLIAVADANEMLASDLAYRYGFERATTEWREVAAATDVDAVSVVLPNHEHRPVVEGLLAAGKHVLCEKPLAPTAADAYAMLEAARAAGVVHMVGFNLRRAPAVAAIQTALARGDLGEPRHLLARYLTDYALSPQAPFTWRYRRDLAGGGALNDIGAHIIDMGRYLLGEIESIQGATLTTFVTERPVPRGQVIGHERAEASGEMAAVDTDDVVAFTARFANGVAGDFAANRVAAGYRNSAGFTLIGSTGAATFDSERFGEFGYFDGRHDDDLNGFRRVVTGPKHPYLQESLIMPVAGVGHGYAETFIAQAYEFLRAIAGGNTVASPSFADGYANALVCEAAQRSAELGRAVTIADVVQAVEADAG
jgi:predicted dehydrogenase